MLANEKRINGGGNAYFPNPDALGAGTDWQKLIFNSAAKDIS